MVINLNIVLSTTNTVLQILSTRAHYEDTREVVDYSIIGAMLVLGILLSLWGTLSKIASPVHKVLALLLLSVFVVFLWMHQTQFLFVYLVYILAFVGAVLMLFLSVVLMLPISTINQNSLRALIIFMYESSNRLRPEGAETAHYSLSRDIHHEILGTPYFWVPFIFIWVPFSVYAGGYIWDDLCHRYDLCKDGRWKAALLLSPLAVWASRPPFNLRTYLTELASFWKDVLNKTLTFLKSHFKSFMTWALSKDGMEILLQVWVFLLLFFTALPVTVGYKYPATAIMPVMDFVNETDGGLANIKVLLYGDASLFLLLSTIVLLVALIGAAVMTRNKR